MPSQVIVNNLTVVHRTSDGLVTGFPDVCNTPSPGGPLPIPYPNVARSMDTGGGTSTVLVQGNPMMIKPSYFAISTGDEPGTGLGVISGKIKGRAYPRMYSFDVKAEGENVFRLTDIMCLNGGSPTNTPPFPEVQPPLPSMPPGPLVDPLLPEVTKLQWSKTQVVCGDEVDFEVAVKNLPEQTAMLILLGSETAPDRHLGMFTVALDGGAGSQPLIAMRGRYQPQVKQIGSQGMLRGVEKTPTALEIKAMADLEETKGPFERLTPAYSETRSGVWEPTEINGVIQNYGWVVCYALKIAKGKFTITRKLDFNLVEGAAYPSAATLQRWKREIENVWSRKFRVHRENCGRGDRCHCAPDSGCCGFAINVVCEFGPGHAEPVNLHKGKNDPNWGDPRWWYSNDWYEETLNVPSTVRAHEFGHLIGMYDEYPEGACDPYRRYTDDETSIMNAGKAVYPRHFQEFFDWLQSQCQGLLGNLKLVKM